VTGRASKLQTEAFKTVRLNFSHDTFSLQTVLADHYELSRIVRETKLCVSIRWELLRFLNEDLQEILRETTRKKDISISGLSEECPDVLSS
jgi:hypothetical protein